MNHDLSGAPEPTPLEKKRFLAIQLVRLSGVALVLLGVLISGGKIDLPPLVGYVIVLVGLTDVFLMPRLLARRWRSPDK